MSEARWIVGDVFDGLAMLPDASVDLCLASPPFLAVRSYLPADHPDKGREIGGEANPAAFIDTLLRVVAECGRVLAPHGSLVFELGDTYAGSGGAGGDYDTGAMRDGQPRWVGSAGWARAEASRHASGSGAGWPLAKSKCLIPEAFAIALAYGINPLTGQPSPAGRWRIRNMIAWCRTNPPVGALGDKFRPAHSELIVACRNTDRYFDDIPTRRPAQGQPNVDTNGPKAKSAPSDVGSGWLERRVDSNPAGAPLLDWWVINNTGFAGPHFATYPPELCKPVIASMCPEKVCCICGQPSRRIVESGYAPDARGGTSNGLRNPDGTAGGGMQGKPVMSLLATTTGWSDCGHNQWRRGHVLDPFAGSGTTLAAATGAGRDATGVDLDPRNLEHARTRLGMFLTDEVTA